MAGMGEAGERIAEGYLVKQGYRVLARNYAANGGEIDLVVERDGALVFVEVKLRTAPRRGEAIDAIDSRKVRRICRAALHYLHAHGALERRVRFDVVLVEPPDIRHIPGAFDYIK
ncbi:MAG: YraN family protein [Clostridiales bacterium]|nr:YraN family protein [Clostridiales bacterium]